jgi:dihydroorotate dehydrogenase (NAD+) catalytic subunit
MKPDLSVDIAGIRMKNPIMPASGCFGYGEDIVRFFDLSLLGAAVTKGTTLVPWEGNEQPRMAETRAGLINFIGLQNPGVDVVIREKMRFLRQFDVPVIVNVSGKTTGDYVGVVRRFEKTKDAFRPEALEINISCPNIKVGGMLVGQDPDIAAKLISDLRKITSITLIVKLTPNVTDIVAVARAVVQAGANALSLINTLKGRVKILRGPHAGKWVVGGLSGPAIKPVALQKVYEVAQAKLGVPIIGMGGIQFLEDVLEFLEAGADAVAIGTANFIEPMTMPNLITGLEKHMTEKGYASIQDLKQALRNSQQPERSKA